MKSQLATLGTACLLAAGALSPAAAADWSDTSIGYRYGTKFAEPYNGKDIKKNIINLTHVSGYKYGTNFLNVDLLNSDSKDNGAQEAYVVYRHTLDLGKATGKSLGFGPVSGVGLTAGFDWNTKNDTGYASKKRMLVVGPTLFMAVPAGFLNVGLHLLRESNFPVGTTSRYTYDTHAALNTSWGIPVGSTGFSFEGYANYIASKGTNEFGGPTSPEFHLDAKLMYDVSASLSLPKNSLKAGVEYEYWRNKFGNVPAPGFSGTLAKTPMAVVEYHF